MADTTTTRGVQNGCRQAFIYRGVQVIPTLDGGWLALIGGRIYSDANEDEICFEIDATHIMIEAVQHRDTAPCAGVAHIKQAISGGGRRSSPSHGSRRYSTSKRGAA